jgi:hypothetical protein
VRQVEADEGQRPDLPGSLEREELRALHKEVYANEILQWVADFTYLRCWEGVVLDALRMALTRCAASADVDLVHHSDAGSRYTSYAFTQVLDDHATSGCTRRPTTIRQPNWVLYASKYVPTPSLNQ